MELTKAIEILARLAKYLNNVEDLERATALKLGIEALKEKLEREKGEQK